MRTKPIPYQPRKRVIENPGNSIATANKKLQVLLKEKKVIWSEVKKIIQSTSHHKHNSSSILDSLLRQALKKAFLDTSVCQSTLKLLLKKTHVDHSQRLKYAVTATRCGNRDALTTLIYDDTSVLFQGRNENTSIYCNEYQPENTRTLLHIVCEKNGWNNEIAYVLKETLENRDMRDSFHRGMFEPDCNGFTPLVLALEAGSSLNEIVHHLRQEYPVYFQQHLCRLSKVCAEYCCDITLYESLIAEFPIILNEPNEEDDAVASSRTEDQEFIACCGRMPLHYACFYQNKDMLYALLHAYKEQEGRKNLLKSKLLATTRNSQGNMIKSPISHLLLNAGDADTQSIWDCLHTCIRFFDRIDLLHTLIQSNFEDLVSKRNCVRIVERLVDNLNLDIFALDSQGESILSLLVVKMSRCKDKKKRHSAKKLLESILSKANKPDNLLNDRLFMDSKKRLPLHTACESGLHWRVGTEILVNSNIQALREADPVTKLLPFALAATCERSDLNNIYNMLRFDPSVVTLS